MFMCIYTTNIRSIGNSPPCPLQGYHSQVLGNRVKLPFSVKTYKRCDFFPNFREKSFFKLQWKSPSMFYVSRMNQIHAFMQRGSQPYHRRELNAVFEIKTSGTRGDTRFVASRDRWDSSSRVRESHLFWLSSSINQQSILLSTVVLTNHPLPPCPLDWIHL